MSPKYGHHRNWYSGIQLSPGLLICFVRDTGGLRDHTASRISCWLPAVLTACLGSKLPCLSGTVLGLPALFLPMLGPKSLKFRGATVLERGRIFVKWRLNGQLSEIRKKRGNRPRHRVIKACDALDEVSIPPRLLGLARMVEWRELGRKTNENSG